MGSKPVQFLQLQTLAAANMGNDFVAAKFIFSLQHCLPLKCLCEKHFAAKSPLAAGALEFWHRPSLTVQTTRTIIDAKELKLTFRLPSSSGFFFVVFFLTFGVLKIEPVLKI